MSKSDLIPMDERTEEERKRIAKQGGIASGKARRRKRTMQEAARLVLNLPVRPEQGAILTSYGIPQTEQTNIMLIAVKAIQLAFEGDMRAAAFVRDLIGENPKLQLYEKKLEAISREQKEKFALADEWVNSIPEIE